MKSKTTILVAIVIVVVVIVGGAAAWYATLPTSTTSTPTPTTTQTPTITTTPTPGEGTVLKVFHAGSLTVPFEAIKENFESAYPEVEVQLEPAGSVACVQKITELGKEADVLASADYKLIPDMMMPEYADWYVLFAKNKMVLTYSENSMYADEINADNWYQILRRDDVKFGFSNPNLDPCGYRTPMVIQLAELEYGDDKIFDDLVLANSAITVTEEGDTYQITAPENLSPNTERLTIRDKSVELVAFVQEGGLDYAFEYSSVAVQHGLKYVELPSSIDLSDVQYADTYMRAKILLTTGDNQVGTAIVYGVTVPTNAPNAELGAEFIKYIINESGQEIFEEQGQPPIVPAIVDNIENAPDSLKEYVTG
jgi:molybdate/tungstate transport system substrate-binding protein